MWSTLHYIRSASAGAVLPTAPDASMLHPVMFGAKEFRPVPSDDKDVSRMALTMPTAECIALNPALEGLWRAQLV